MARWIAAIAEALTLCPPLRAREMVPRETPATAATSSMVGREAARAGVRAAARARDRDGRAGSDSAGALTPPVSPTGAFALVTPWLRAGCHPGHTRPRSTPSPPSRLDDSGEQVRAPEPLQVQEEQHQRDDREQRPGDHQPVQHRFVRALVEQ